MTQALERPGVLTTSTRGHAPKTVLKIDPLRERVAAPELEVARSTLERGGVTALLELATTAVARAESTRGRFEMLARDLQDHPKERETLVEAYLRETVKNARALKDDLRALRRKQAWVLDLSALAERVARSIADDERSAEVALALAKKAIEERPVVDFTIAPVLELAKAAGRWSRRTEALGLIASMARLGAIADDKATIIEAILPLTERAEQRWVQPAAIAAIAAYDAAAATRIARERLASPEPGDDFLVRERIVELAGRGALGRGVWESVVTLAAGDPSEHVRITTARSERDPVRLTRLASSDASAKVRASALITLTQRDVAAAELSLVSAVGRDGHPLVVRTAAEELAALARRGRTRDSVAVIDALGRATHREGLDETVRARIADALLEVSVFSDVVLRAAHDALAPLIAETPVGGHATLVDPIVAGLDDEQLGRVIAVLARDDFALGVDRVKKGTGVVVHRGEARGTAGWRILHELRNPSPSKRQAFQHTWGRAPTGSLRAPPGGLAELTATRVPGERVLSERAGGWGRQLPLVDDLLSTGVLRGRVVTLVGSSGTTTITPPSAFFSRVAAWSKMSRSYAELAELRQRSLDSDEPATQSAYVNEIARNTGFTVRFAPHTFEAGAHRIATPPPCGLAGRTVTHSLIPGGRTVTMTVPPSPPSEPKRAGAPMLSVFAPAALAPFAEQLGGLKDTWHDLLDYATSPHGNRLPHLAAYACVMLGAMMVRGVVMRRSIEHDRSKIPLVIGGWGTRGKSGTERLKAALFQGLGHETLVKTTGCEAMFIHAIPGVDAREVFIYRPYDKATVWEQRDVLELARRLRVRVFLWECMALQPDLVNLLQSQWMRDDYSTITNAYPDHEDVQGPSGYDVANVISEFVPTHGNLITSEEQMLPILRERAKERDTKLRIVGARDAELLADDLLTRFPYQEHPKNIALVTSLARTLGIPAAVAIAEMADHVVPDLGVLKRYPWVPHRGRQLSFVNGMSANERTGALQNWVRSGLDRHDVDATPNEWVVTLVNNRGDRVARSEVFARFLVEDIGAHAHFLIGTNVGGLHGFMREALKHHLTSISPTHDLEGDGTERLHTARARVDAAFRRLKVGRLDAPSVLAELSSFELPVLDVMELERVLEPSEPGETYEQARAAIESSLSKTIEGASRPFVVASIAKRRAVRAVHAIVSRDLGANPGAVDRAFSAAYRAIFEESLVLLDDASLTGDQILEAIAQHAPPAARVTIMGVQNIKGTGLDFVYRWVSIDVVTRHLVALDSPSLEKREDALRALLHHGDYGLLDAKLALAKVRDAKSHDKQADELPYEPVLARLTTLVETRSKKIAARTRRTIGERIRGVIGSTFDYLDATRRRKMAGELLSALVMGRVSHASAAERMREIIARAKGGWAQRAPSV